MLKVQKFARAFSSINCFSVPVTFMAHPNSSSVPSVSQDDLPAGTVKITSTPRAGQHIFHDNKRYNTIKEGLAYILVPPDQPTVTDPKQKAKGKGGKEDDDDVQGVGASVFYNPIQQFNRDLSVLAIRAYGEEALERRKLKERRKGKGRGSDGRSRRGKEKPKDEDESMQGKGEEIGIESTEPEAVNTAEFGEGHVPGIQGQKRKRDAEDISRGEKADKVALHEDKPDEDGAEGTGRLKRAKANPNGMGIAHDTDSAPNGDETSGNANGLSSKGGRPPQFRILDALSATGLRALRYAHEIPFATAITAIDLLHQATDAIKVNVLHNRLEDTIHPVTNDARKYMYNVSGPQAPDEKGRYKGKYDVIDLDPYGTAAPFLDAAVQALNDGGLLCVTCTDAGVWASVGYLEKCHALYGGVPIKGPHSHEGGLRLILHSIALSASRYGLAVEPLLSLSIDFYARVFVRVRRAPLEVKLLAGKTMSVYNCDSGCGAWSTQLHARNKEQKDKKGNIFYKHVLGQAPNASPKCEHCGFRTHLAGPMWAGPLHNPYFIQRILTALPSLDEEVYGTINRIKGMLTTALEEDLVENVDMNKQASSPAASSTFPALNPALIDHHPFYFIPGALCKVLHCQTPSEDQLRGAFKSMGYRVTRSHTKPGTFKTDAPWGAIWEIMREWVRQHAPIKEEGLKEGMAGYGIMQRKKGGERDSLELLKHSVLNALEASKDMEAAKTAIEAALYRATRNEGVVETTNGEVVGAAGEGGNAATSTETSSNESTSKNKIVFDAPLGRQPERDRLLRYQMNPKANWGPMNRAKGTGVSQPSGVAQNGNV